MVDKIDRQKMAAKYGFALAFMKSNDELWALFNKATKQTWTPEMFVARLRDTKWFKNHSASVRNAIMQQKADPATYEASVNQMFATVRDTFGSMFGNAAMDPKDMRQWAETAHRMGWTQAQLVDRMTASMNFRKMLRKDTLGGSAAELEGQIDQLMSLQGIQLGQKWKARQIEQVMKGNNTVAGIQQKIRDLAMQEYRGFADRIKAGETVADIAEPYRQIMADLLEMDPDEINLNSKKIQAALKQTDDEGKPKAMDLNAFADFVRKDERWQYTDNARQQMSSLTADLLKQFGLMAG